MEKVFKSVSFLAIADLATLRCCRGEKGTNWEGGTRVPAFVHSPLLDKAGYVSDKMIHVTDWMPTLLAAAGMDRENITAVLGVDDVDVIDGVDQYNVIFADGDAARDNLHKALNSHKISN